jgi:hypothetical protein
VQYKVVIKNVGRRFGVILFGDEPWKNNAVQNSGGFKATTCQQNFQGHNAEDMYDTRHNFGEMQAT